MTVKLPKRARGISYGAQFLLLSFVALAVYGILFLVLNNGLLESLGLNVETNGFEWADKILGVTVALAGAWVTLAIAQRTLRNSEEMEILQLRSHVKEDVQAYHDFFEALNRLHAKVEDMVTQAMENYLDEVEHQLGELSMTDKETKSQKKILHKRLTLEHDDFNEVKALRAGLLEANRKIEINSSAGKGPISLAFNSPSLSSQMLAHNDWIARPKAYRNSNLKSKKVIDFDPAAISPELAYDEFKAKRLNYSDLNEVHQSLALVFRREWLSLMCELVGSEVRDMHAEVAKSHSRYDKDGEWAEQTAHEKGRLEREFEMLSELRENIINAEKEQEDLNLSEELKVLLDSCEQFSPRSPLQEKVDAVDHEAQKVLLMIDSLSDELSHHLAASADHLDSLRNELIAVLTGYYSDDPMQENGVYRRYVRRTMQRSKNALSGSISVGTNGTADFISKAAALVFGEVLFPHFVAMPESNQPEANLNVGMAYLLDFLSNLPDDLSGLLDHENGFGSSSRLSGTVASDIVNRPPPISISLMRLVEAAKKDPDLFVQQHGGVFDYAWAQEFRNDGDKEESGTAAVLTMMSEARCQIVQSINASTDQQCDNNAKPGSVSTKIATDDFSEEIPF